MKIDYISDIHLENWLSHPLHIFDIGVVSRSELKERGDVLVLAGDIVDMYTWNKRTIWVHEFFEYVSSLYENIILVAGNHEHYGGNINDTYYDTKSLLKDLPNIHVLENETITINNIRFIATTLWTDMNKSNPLDLRDCQVKFNDFYHISDGDLKFTSHDYVTLHEKAMSFLRGITFTKNDVIVTHMAPTTLSADPHYSNSSGNALFYSNLYDFVYDSGAPLWIHGHTHYAVDYIVNNTRVVCNNPRQIKQVEI